jgi:hypothetical protein
MALGLPARLRRLQVGFERRAVTGTKDSHSEHVSKMRFETAQL